MHFGRVVNADLPTEQICVQQPGWVPIINPDIKLGNVVLGDAQQRYPTCRTAKVIDFGHAQRCQKVTDKSKMMGTCNLCPPVNAVVIIL